MRISIFETEHVTWKMEGEGERDGEKTENLPNFAWLFRLGDRGLR